jgi:hypothetical protein
MQKHISLLRKIASPLLVVFSFLFIALAFAVMHQPTKSHSSATAIFWFEFITKGMPAGLMFTLFAWLRTKNCGATLGIKQEQVPQLKEALQTGVLPKDKKLRAALPAYMYNTYSWSKPRSRKIVIFLAIIFGFNLLIAIEERNLLKLAVDVIVVTAFAGAYISFQKKALVAAGFYEQLGIDPESAKPAMPKIHQAIPIQWKSGFVHIAKSLLTVASAIFGTALISVAIGEAIISPWIIMSIWVPLGLVGILYLAPYFVLSGRWARGYCVLLALTTSVVIHQLHMPLGHSHHVGAQAPVPADGHSVAVYTIWAIMHSTIALIITGAIVILAVIFAKKHERPEERDLWTIFATVGVALTLLSFGFSWPKANHPVEQTTTSVSPASDTVPDAKPDQPDTTNGNYSVKVWDPSMSAPPTDTRPWPSDNVYKVPEQTPLPADAVIVVPQN